MLEQFDMTFNVASTCRPTLHWYLCNLNTTLLSMKSQHYIAIYEISTLHWYLCNLNTTLVSMKSQHYIGIYAISTLHWYLWNLNTTLLSMKSQHYIGIYAISTLHWYLWNLSTHFYYVKFNTVLNIYSKILFYYELIMSGLLFCEYDEEQILILVIRNYPNFGNDLLDLIYH